MAAKEIAERAPPSCRVEEISALLVCFPVLRRQVMRRFSCSILFASICVVVTAQQPSTPANLHFNGQSWWEKVKVIADDKMEGRDTGSRGEHAAQEYAIAEFKKAGVQSAGVNGFYQPVRFVSRRLVESESSLALISAGKREPLTLGEDAIISTHVMPAQYVKADLVFAGYALKIPEANYDDFAGLDCKGKLVVSISGSPSEIAGAIASHYQTTAERWRTLKSVGAIGMITIRNPALAEMSWQRVVINNKHSSMELDYPEFDDTAGEKLTAYFNPAHAEKLFAGSGHEFADVLALAQQHKMLPHFALAVSLEATTKVESGEVESANVIGKLPGSDPELKNEFIVLSAHLDHLGVGEPVNGDRIYNGAMDNGSGSALLLDMAQSFQKDPAKLRRSVLFLLVTGEEKGLLGSKYFAAHPTVPMKSIVADINTDMYLPIVPLKVLTVHGLVESNLGDLTREAAQSVGAAVQSDPEPQHNVFIRSDQYNFIRHGVPSLMIDIGAYPGTPEMDVYHAWLKNRYHAPSDDVNQPIDLEAEAKYEEVIRRLLISVANDDRRPEWKANSFFKRYAQ
jgi:Zn-dependent M28 family amino/carboxypeptidase